MTYYIDWIAVGTSILAVATAVLAVATFKMARHTKRSASAAERAVEEMKIDREERNRPKIHLLQHRSEGWPFSLDCPLYLRIDDFHKRAHAEWPDLRWNVIIIRNVGKGETGPGTVSNIEYVKERPETIKQDDLSGFELRSIMPGESYAKLFAVQEIDPEREDTPLVKFTYTCEKVDGVTEYPPRGKKDWFLDVYPETKVRVTKET